VLDDENWDNIDWVSGSRVGMCLLLLFLTQKNKRKALLSA
jgi:hypothetical protein